MISFHVLRCLACCSTCFLALHSTFSFEIAPEHGHACKFFVLKAFTLRVRLSVCVIGLLFLAIAIVATTFFACFGCGLDTTGLIQKVFEVVLVYEWHALIVLEFEQSDYLV